MKIRIVHLYYDLLNLYGESGNVRVLKKIFEELGIDVEIVFKTVGDKLNFNEYDLIYIGMGIRDNLKIALKHLSEYKNDLKAYIENNGYVISTGNSYEMFGKKIEFTNEKIEGLNIFNFKSYELSERKIQEISAKTTIVKDEIIGFMNTGSFNNNKKNNLFKIKEKDEYIKEGIHYNNFFGTYIIGPILIRNPYLLKKIVFDLVSSKDKNYKIKNFDISILEEAYNDTIKRRLSKTT